MVQGARGGGYEANFLCSVIFQNFPNDENSGYINDIKLIFGRCHRSWAAATPGKYEHDWKYLTYTFAKSKFPVTEEINERSFSNPHPRAVSNMIQKRFVWDISTLQIKM